jgi:hypothetical protein
MTGVDSLTSYLVEPWMSWHQGFYKTVQLENVAYSILFYYIQKWVQFVRTFDA